MQLLEWSKKPIMTSGIDKPQTVKKSKAKIMTIAKCTQAVKHKSTYQSTAMQIQVACSFSRTHDVPSTLWLGLVYGSTSLHRLRRLAQRMLEKQTLRWNPLPVVPGADRNVVVPVRTEGHCQSQRHDVSRLLYVSIKFWVSSCSRFLWPSSSCF